MNGARMKMHILENHPNFQPLLGEPNSKLNIPAYPTQGQVEDDELSDNRTIYDHSNNPLISLSISPSASSSSIQPSQAGIKLRLIIKTMFENTNLFNHIHLYPKCELRISGLSVSLLLALEQAYVLL